MKYYRRFLMRFIFKTVRFIPTTPVNVATFTHPYRAQIERAERFEYQGVRTKRAPREFRYSPCRITDRRRVRLNSNDSIYNGFATNYGCIPVILLQQVRQNVLTLK